VSGTDPKHVYQALFFDYLAASSRRSALAAVPRLAAVIAPSSVLDVGCGRGVWLERWVDQGVEDVCGVDGDYVDMEHLVIPRSRFYPHDLGVPFDLGRKFDLVLSLEVGEHLNASVANTFIDTIVTHGDVVVFSAAVPGQGGEYHVNEQSLDYWRAKFLARGFDAFDAIRPMWLGVREIEPWYRYNTLLYANQKGRQRLPASVLATQIPEDCPVPDVASIPWRLRNLIIGKLPDSVVRRLAEAKHSARVALARTRSLRHS
jgi:SAM-dependent methyltransferase